MIRLLSGVLLAVVGMVGPVHAQSTLKPAPAPGVWRCVANSQIVTIDVNLQVAANGQLAGQGTIIYLGTWQTYNIAGYGRWAAMPPDQNSNEWLFHFQFAPQNHSVVSVYARPTNNPNFLNNRFYNPQTGNTTETSCQKLQ